MIKKLFKYTIFLLILFTKFLNAEEKFLSLKKDTVNVRYNPSFDSEIKYVYKKINLPLGEKINRSLSFLPINSRAFR